MWADTERWSARLALALARDRHCVITGRTATEVQAAAPPDGNIAPPGWYLLFVVDTDRAPSTGAWIRLT
jgi:hypothetical protein